jgi:hypothetical protein
MALANPVFGPFPNTDGHLAAAAGFAFRLPGWNLGNQSLTPVSAKSLALTMLKHLLEPSQTLSALRSESDSSTVVLGSLDLIG